jgi:hypothetical protein
MGNTDETPFLFDMSTTTTTDARDQNQYLSKQQGMKD